MLCYRSFRHGKAEPAFVLVGGLLACSAAYSLNPAMVFGVVTVALIYLACRIGTIDRWLSQPIFQYLGKISYSLYLLNILVAWNILRLGFKITGYNEPASLVWFILAGAGSIAAAHLFYTFVEKPSVALGQKVKDVW
jgi:peptidoglycan/LPS O-acetylase OafA/YrhL